MTNGPTILYAGTYERTYPRNQQLIRLLRRSGGNVIEIHEPFWEKMQDKSRSFRGVAAIVFAMLSLCLAQVRMICRVIGNMRGCQALMIGYIGQIDMLTIGVLGRLTGRPVIFNPLVTLTDTVVEDRTLVSRDSMIARLIWLVDWLTMRIATQVITDTEANAEYLTGTFNLSRNRISVLHVGADEAVFRDVYRVRSDRATIDVLFYGKMVPLHGIETILTAIQQLHASAPQRFRFEIIGSGQHTDHVLEFVESSPECQITYRSWVAYRRLAQRVANADVVLGIFGAGAKAARVIPNKVFQAMAVGAPIITRDSPAIREVLDEQSALLIPPGDSDALCSALQRLEDPEYREQLGRGAREAFERYGTDVALLGEVSEMLADQGLTGRSS